MVSSSARPSPAALAVHQRLRILLVEDDLDVADLLRFMLSARGHTVNVVHDGADAEPAFDLLEPDLVVLDVGLPSVDGVELCRRLRARSDVALLILSARGSVADIERGLAGGADDYVPKPFTSRDLEQRIAAVTARNA